MASSDIVNQCVKISKKKFILKYSYMNFSGLSDYEKTYNYLKGKTKPKFIKLFSQYILQSILGVCRTDYGVVKTDFFVSSSDLLVGLLSSLQLLKNGKTVIFSYYNLNDYDLIPKLYSEKRYETVPRESINLISGELGTDIATCESCEEVIKKLINMIKDNYSENFAFIRNVSLSSFFEIENNTVCSIIRDTNQDIESTDLASLNELLFLDTLIAGDNSHKNRQKGRVISMIKANRVIVSSQKTKESPRIPMPYEIKIADGSRQTKDSKEIFIKDRNKDIIEALAINEKSGY